MTALRQETGLREEAARTGAGSADGAELPPRQPLRATLVLLVGLGLVIVLSAVHVTQGTASVGAADLLRLLTGDADQQVIDILVTSRLARLTGGLCVGVALGVAGMLLQSVARNALASPDTLGVNAGAFVAIVVAAVVGVSLPALPSGAIAFCGGLLAAGLVLVLSSGASSSPARLVLAGSAVTLALAAVSATLLLIDEFGTQGLFAWGAGSLVQSGLDTIVQLAPVIVLGVVAALALARSLDVLALGDDTAQVLGVAVRRTRIVAVLLAVLLTASAVTIAGPIGFVGLLAPTIVRLVGRWVAGLGRHAVQLPATAIAGCIVVLGADVLTRALLGGTAGVDIPTGVVTTLFGAPVLIWLARSSRDSGPTRTPPAASVPPARTRRSFAVVVVAILAVTLGVAVCGLLAGDPWFLLGDISNWVTGQSSPAIAFQLDQRLPRVVISLLAGAALAVAGGAIQAVARNPLAEPGIIGVTAGAGAGAVGLIILIPTVSATAVSLGAVVGALVAFVAVYAFAWRGEMSPDRFVLVGIGLSALASALTTAIAVSGRFSLTSALTWLSGSTYGRTLDDALPLLIALLLAVPLLAIGHRYLDLLALDDDTPRVLGVRLEPVRLGILAGAALVTAAAVSAVGVVGFVGLVAPHAARALVGGRHARVFPVAALLGGVVVCVADTAGRLVLAPNQLPAGVLTALIGTPYFIWLLWRSRG